MTGREKVEGIKSIAVLLKVQMCMIVLLVKEAS